MALRRDQSSLLAAAVASVVLWAVPVLRPVALPLVYLNTHIHELCHALMAWSTGGNVQLIKVSADGSGVTPVVGGSLVMTASAGYVGAAVVGALIVAGARGPRGAKAMLWTVCGFLAASLLLFVRGDLVGLASSVFWIVLLAFLALRLKGTQALFAAQFLGVQMALTSFQALFVLLQLTVSTEVTSDAQILQSATGIPALVWALGWSVVGLAAVVGSLAAVWRPASLKRLEP